MTGTLRWALQRSSVLMFALVLAACGGTAETDRAPGWFRAFGTSGWDGIYQIDANDDGSVTTVMGRRYAKKGEVLDLGGHEIDRAGIVTFDARGSILDVLPRDTFLHTYREPTGDAVFVSDFDYGNIIERVAADGTVKWKRSIDSDYFSGVGSVGFSADGATYLFCLFGGSVWFDGEPPLESPDSTSTLTAKLGAEGELLWVQVMANASGTGIVTPAERVFVVGPGGDTNALFLAELSSSGQLLWKEDRYPKSGYATLGANDEIVAAVELEVAGQPELHFLSLPLSPGKPASVMRTIPMSDAELAIRFLRRLSHGGWLLGGSLKGTMDFGHGPWTTEGQDPAPFVVELDSKFSPLTAILPNSATFGTAEDADVDPAGAIVLGGYFQGELDLGVGRAHSAVGYDPLYDWDAFIASIPAGADN